MCPSSGDRDHRVSKGKRTYLPAEEVSRTVIYTGTCRTQGQGSAYNYSFAVVGLALPTGGTMCELGGASGLCMAGWLDHL